MIQKYLIIWLSLLSLLAYGWAHNSWSGDPFQASMPYLKYLFAFTMVIIGGLLPPEEIRLIFRKWYTVLGGTTLQFLIMPVLAYTVGSLFGLPKELFVGIILVGTVPGAMASNVLTLISKGNVSYSVCLTSSATLLSPFIVPFLLYQFVNIDDIDKSKMVTDAFILLLTQVLVPVLSGYFLARQFPLVERFFQSAGPTWANLSILWIIAAVVNKSQPAIAEGSLTTSILLVLFGALLTVNVFGYLGGYCGGLLLPLTEPMRRALTLEIGMQNAGLGSVLAIQLFKEETLIALPPALYAFGCMFTGTILAQYWSRKPVDTEEFLAPPIEEE